MAYRLFSVLQWKLKEACKKDSRESADTVLQALDRVERVEVLFGNDIKTLYRHVTKELTDTLREIGMREILRKKVILIERE